MNRKSPPASLFSHLDETTPTPASAEDGAAVAPVFSSAGNGSAPSDEAGPTAGGDQ
ncbi:hypothetical protein IU438_05075 [Nocardia cyriacigeorgica]|jgi:hypothetical protein|uniref:hypothetical protein n=1 Tax=Nocardia cyriacigeorgica TaxID=135487 RepID=UPI001319CDEA|nr:hypothetical protein [Nocardia cyriacigeorgica]MBF6086467.1 hypothetical protein [Nocardia cyriacigeorgica]MBF6091220.1 hypothetical protein [Nocardia cyriacigeorgica]MBF6097522.1 hypothetical protein [Nocardia cyriacigeorgica]MBF6321905.1 hypothetical protein [Nocardia cyriacigeorgica]MBF6395156.1 hypothetical protein [Nocardia cyriacigeorgica]